MTFEDCQKLQRFHWKLAQASPALEGNICVLRTCEERWQGIAGSPRVQATLLEIRSITMQLEFHREVIRKLGEQARQAASLVGHVLLLSSILALKVAPFLANVSNGPIAAQNPRFPRKSADAASELDGLCNIEHLRFGGKNADSPQPREG